MRARPTSWLLVIVLGASGLGGCKDFKKGVTESYDKEFKISFERQFTDSCAKGAVAQGAPEARAKSMCGCMAKGLVARHSTTELTKLSVSPSSDESKTVIGEAAAACKSGGGESPKK